MLRYGEMQRQHQGRTRQFPQPVQCRLVNRRDSHWHSINRWHRIIHRRYVWRRVGRRGRRCLRLNRGRCLRLQDKSAMGTINRLIVIRLSTSWTIPHGIAPPSLQLLFQCVEYHPCALINITSAHGENQVARPHMFKQVGRDLFKGGGILRAGNTFGNLFGTDAVGIFFAGPHNITDDYLIGNRKRGDESFQMTCRTGIGERLKNRPHPAVTHTFGRLQSGTDFGGMVGIIVRHRHLTRRSQKFKTTAGTVKIGNPLHICSAEAPQRYAAAAAAIELSTLCSPGTESETCAKKMPL